MATNWAVFPEGSEPPKSVAALAEQVGRDGGRRPRDLPGTAQGRLAALRAPAARARRADALPARSLEAPRQAAPGGHQAARPVRRPDRRGVRPAPASTGRRTATTGARRSRSSRPSGSPRILMPEPEVAYQILALNTEKAHNVKEKSLEVIRMYRGLVEEGSTATEEDFALPVRGARTSSPSGSSTTREPRFAGGRLRAAPPPRRQVPEVASPEGLRRARAARRARPGRGRRAGRRGRQGQEARR